MLSLGAATVGAIPVLWAGHPHPLHPHQHQAAEREAAPPEEEALPPHASIPSPSGLDMEGNLNVAVPEIKQHFGPMRCDFFPQTLGFSHLLWKVPPMGCPLLEFRSIAEFSGVHSLFFTTSFCFRIFLLKICY